MVKRIRNTFAYTRRTNCDIKRIEVQQDFIKELVKQKLNPGILAKIPALTKTIGETVETDIKESEWSSFASIALKMDKDSLNTYQMPGGARYISGASYYLQDEAETKKLIGEILERQKSNTKPKKEEPEE